MSAPRFVLTSDSEGAPLIWDRKAGVPFCYPAYPEDAEFVCAALNAHHKRHEESEIG